MQLKRNTFVNLSNTTNQVKFNAYILERQKFRKRNNAQKL